MVAEAWSWEEEKAFEDALAIYYEACSDWWEKIAAAVPGKTLAEIKCHYEILAEDVHSIESGRVPLPSYASSSSSTGEGSGDGGGNKKKIWYSAGGSGHGAKSSRLDHERRKGIAWTEEEHRLFLLGLDKYGKGDWRSISRNFVVSRTPTQVASHAQKYFIRLNLMNRDRRRSSIHDITSISNGGVSTSQGPITGQGNVPSPLASKPDKQTSQPTPAAHGWPLMPAVGTPVAGSHMAYGLRPPPVTGVVITAGAPMRLAPPVLYPMPNASSRR